ncbi:MAG: glycerophosphodiester phosphodiesterase [Burkholderiales bacterium]|nr:glycerophosphodiester phosphodiesterase [Burkholderiales bacterium]
MLVFAHRGLHHEYLENSFEAIVAALASGCQALEVDLQLTRDHKIILMHDFELKRLYGVERFVADLTFAEIQCLDNQVGKLGRLICLEELLCLVPANVLLNLELKTMQWYKTKILVNGVFNALNNMKRNVIISSFNPYLLMRYRKLDAQCCIAPIFGANLYCFKLIVRLTGIKPSSIHFSEKIMNQSLLVQMHKGGLKIYVYTVNDQQRYAELAQMGVDGVFSDNPQLFEDN